MLLLIGFKKTVCTKSILLLKIALLCFLGSPTFVFSQNEQKSIQEPITEAEKLLKAVNLQFESVVQGDTSIQQKAEELLAKGKTIGSPVAESKSLMVLGLLYQRKGNAAKSRNYFLACANLREKTNDKSGLASVYNNLGVLEQEYGNYDVAIKYAEMALSLRKTLNDLAGLAASFTNIGNIYENKGLVDRALESHLQALQLYEKTKNLMGEAGTYSNLANLYKLKSKERQAMGSYKKALQIYTQLGKKDGRALVLTNMASLLTEGANWKQGLDYALEALEIKRSLGQDESLVYSLITVAELFIKQNNTQVADVYLTEAYEKSLALHNVSLQLRCLKLMANVQARQGIWDKAYLLQLRFSRQQDSLDAAVSMQNLAKIENQYFALVSLNKTDVTII
jgi:tetratricopeptide (TPR) repeat protein